MQRWPHSTLSVSASEHPSPSPSQRALRAEGLHTPFSFAPDDVLATHYQKVCDKSTFKGTDGADTISSHRLALRIYTELPNEWKLALGSFNEPRPNPLMAERRAKRALQKMARCSPGILYGMLAGMHAIFTLEEEEGASFFPPTSDVVVECLEEYKDSAVGRAAERAERAEKAGKKSTGRGGQTATKRVRMGMYNLFKVTGLPGFHHANSDFAKDVAKHGPAMPRVQPLTPMQTMPHLERLTLDATKSEQFRARAGASWLRKAASPRTKDMLRTPSLSIDSVQVLGLATPVLSGTATKSKASEASQMQLLQWRVPLLPVGRQQDIDLQPLLKSMEGMGDNGGVFRAYEVRRGAHYCLANAIGWADRVATRDEIIADEKELLRGVLSEVELTNLTNHMDRHIIPSVGRVLQLSSAKRATLGYWAEQPVTGDPADAQAMAKAERVARMRRTKAGRLQQMADRYSSREAEPAEHDDARAMCLLAIRSAVLNWDAPGNTFPPSASAQVREIQHFHTKAWNLLERKRLKEESEGASPEGTPAAQR